jgi:hypothetical protein
MSLSGVILLIIVAAWAYVLVPMFLRRYDQASETAPATELQERSRVLARRCAAGSPALVTRAGTTARRPAAARSTPRPDAPSRVRRAVLIRELRSQLRSVQRGTATSTFTATAPAETATATAKATAATATATATAKAGAALKRRRPAPRHRQLIRRRATLGCLSGAVAVSVAVALIVSPLAGVPAGAALLALAGYVVHVRHEVLRAAAFRRTQQAVVLDRRRAVPVTDWLYGVPARTLPVESQPAPTPAVPAVPAVPDDGWLPVPVPLPTYLTAPPAPLRSTPWPDRAPVGSPDRQPIAAASSAAGVEPAEVERPLAVND